MTDETVLRKDLDTGSRGCLLPDPTLSEGTPSYTQGDTVQRYSHTLVKELGRRLIPAVQSQWGWVVVSALAAEVMAEP